MKFSSRVLKFSATPQVNLRRIKQIVEQAQDHKGSWVIISPMRDNWETTLKTLEEGEKPQSDSEEFKARTNELMRAEMEKDIRALGLGYRKCQGIGPEENGGQSREESYFVPDITLDQADKMRQDYRQWCIVYCGPETAGKILLIEGDGSRTDLGSWSTKDGGDQFWTEHKTKPFVFK